MRLPILFTLLVVHQSLAFQASFRCHRRITQTPRMVLRETEVEEQEADPIEFSFEEQKLLETIQGRADDDIKSVIKEYLPTMSPSLIVKLRQSVAHSNRNVRRIALALDDLLEEQVVDAKATLQELLNAGEIRKLDNLIGKAAREKRLDSAFFNILDVNLRDAANEKPEVREVEEATATRLQILQHIYTRCQEEVEKNIPPGTALLNKLLRTEQEPIRKNIYQHYLTPQPNTITTPDGKTVELKGERPVLVSLDDFVEAIANAVKQVRTLETAGAANRQSAAIMVESCRIVAKEARIIIGECYGTDSKELKQFQDGLQPVFRPSSPESVYIKGESN